MPLLQHGSMLNFTKLRGSPGGWRDSFEALVRQVGRIDPPFADAQFRHIHGAGGDGGIEAYWVASNGNEHGYQAKFHLKSGDIDWAGVDGSILTALDTHPRLVAIQVAFACDLTDVVKGRRGQTGWQRWETHKAKWQATANQRGMNVDFLLWTASDIEQRLTRPEAAGLLEYWFDEQSFSDAWFAEQFENTKMRLDERYHPEDHVETDVHAVFEGLRRSPAWRGALRSAFETIAERRIGHHVFAKADCGEGATRLDDAVTALVDMATAVELPHTGGLPVNAWRRLIEAVRTASRDIREILDERRRAAQGKTSDSENYARHGLTQLRSAIDALDDLLTSSAQAADERCFALISGRAGTGKSHLLAAEVSTALAAGEPAVMLLGTDFPNVDEPAEVLATRLGFGKKLPSALLGALSAAAEARNCRALVVIDAANEGAGANLWRERLAAFAVQVLRNDRLALCISYRTEFGNYLLTDSARGQAVEVEVEGFASAAEQEAAARVYMDRRGIVRPATPWLSPEFSNPLFLRTACIALQRQGRTEFPRGLRGTQEVLRFYLEGAARALGTPHDGSLDLLPALRDAFLSLASAMATFRRDFVSRLETNALVDAAFSAFAPPQASTWTDLLIRNGLLRGDPGPNNNDDDPLAFGETVYRFAFQRFQDHLIAQALISPIDLPDTSFANDGPLTFLIARYGLDHDWLGVFQALAIQFADRWQSEIVDCMPGGFHEQWERYGVQDAFLESARWRLKTSFTERTGALLNMLDSHHQVLPLLLELAPVDDHPWNAELLHQALARRPMVERDSTWTHYINEADDDEHRSERIVDWALGPGAAHAPNTTLDLVLTALGWFFTSTNRRLRDRATKAATAILLSRPVCAASFIARFADVDDGYVRERVLASVVGACLRDPGNPYLGSTALAIWQAVFAEGIPTPHILLRDYARCVIDLAADRACLTVEVDVARCHPPYGAAAPDFGLDTNQVEAACEAVGANAIWSSCVGFMGDFGRYVIESRTREITNVPLHDAPPVKSSRWQDRELVKANVQQAQLWVANRVLELGWRKEAFPYDRSYGDDRVRGSRTERIGKKYQWIAYHELLARLADNFWLAAEYSEDEARIYDTPRDLEFTRDVDPTLPAGERVSLSTTGLDSPPQLRIVEVAPEDMKTWVYDADMPLSRLNLGHCTDLGSNDWLTLYRYQSARLDWPGKSGLSGAPFRQDDFHFLLMIAVEREKRQQLIETSYAAKIDFHDWLMHDYTDGPYLYELGNRVTWPDQQWIEEDFRHPRVRYASLSHGYHWESHLDASQPEGFQLRMPNPWLVRALNLRADPWRPGTFLDHEGQPAILSGQEDHNSYCLVRRDSLQCFLEAENLALLWAGIGERTGWPDSGENCGPRRRWNGLMWSVQSGHRHKIWCEDTE